MYDNLPATVASPSLATAPAMKQNAWEMCKLQEFVLLSIDMSQQQLDICKLIAALKVRFPKLKHQNQQQMLDWLRGDVFPMAQLRGVIAARQKNVDLEDSFSAAITKPRFEQQI